MIRYANLGDFDFLHKYDQHISKSELIKCIEDKRILVAFDGDNFIGWLRYNLFWDNTPFMNMLYILDDYQRKGYGKSLVEYWENEMFNKDYYLLLTSTLSNENAQYFYRKLGYLDCGSLFLPGEAEEIFLMKQI